MPLQLTLKLFRGTAVSFTGAPLASGSSTRADGPSTGHKPVTRHLTFKEIPFQTTSTFVSILSESNTCRWIRLDRLLYSGRRHGAVNHRAGRRPSSDARRNQGSLTDIHQSSCSFDLVPPGSQARRRAHEPKGPALHCLLPGRLSLRSPALQLCVIFVSRFAGSIITVGRPAWP